ncbi:outer membrane protein assembly factor BamD [Candidatus Cardinium hertigii]|jgi:outer membrane protein assembly factor BamD|uniref:Outer membrane protein assembly factor BamD n=1 Tax=Candidatus Cardinium hertigii TaxID=247481 RepID=A0A3N2QDA2_9BACT|nr:outer membrane protein assembly factor BamD [Candidatus Cardinium hertigii]ROT47612.1 outer membrane protein assembly factor BamD [Candidatus Cardinium hertigii]
MCRRKHIFFLLLVSCFAGYSFSLSAKREPVDKQKLILKKKEQVVRLYTRKLYAKANERIEELLLLLTSRTDRAEMLFYQAYGNYYQKNYLDASDQFHLFVKQYRSAPQAEEALFMRGYSLACEEVDTRLDQTITEDAIHCLEQYLAVYPQGRYIDRAAQTLQALQERFMKKSFENAQFYFRLGYYKAAIVALTNFEKTYPDSCFQEAVCRLLTKSHEKLAIKETTN